MRLPVVGPSVPSDVGPLLDMAHVLAVECWFSTRTGGRRGGAPPGVSAEEGPCAPSS